MLKRIIVVGILATALATTTASATQLHCKVKPSASQGGWISPEFVFQFDAAANEATVIDGLIDYYFKKPIEAKLTHKDGVKETLSWNVQTGDHTGQLTKLIFRASYFYKDDSFTVSAIPGGYDNSFSGRGTCELGK